MPNRNKSTAEASPRPTVSRREASHARGFPRVTFLALATTGEFFGRLRRGASRGVLLAGEVGPPFFQEELPFRADSVPVGCASLSESDSALATNHFVSIHDRSHPGASFFPGFSVQGANSYQKGAPTRTSYQRRR